MKDEIKIKINNGSMDQRSLGVISRTFRQVHEKKLSVQVNGSGDARNYSNVIVELFKNNMMEDVLVVWTVLRRSEDDEIKEGLDHIRHIFDRAYFYRCVRGGDKNWGGEYLKEALGYTPDPNRLQSEGPVVICAMPRSGSTYLGSILAAYLGRRHVSAHGKGALDTGVFNEFDTLKWRDHVMGRAVIQTHIVPSIPFLCMLHAMGAKPVIVFRNIFEVLLSKANRVQGNYFDEVFGIGKKLEGDAFLKFNIERYSLRIFEFAHIWQILERSGGCKIFDFKTIKTDWMKALETSVRYLGYEWDEALGRTVIDRIDQYSKDNPTSFNRMSAGSKEKMPKISEADKEQVRTIGRYYDPEAVRRLVADEFAHD